MLNQAVRPGDDATIKYLRNPLSAEKKKEKGAASELNQRLMRAADEERAVPEETAKIRGDERAYVCGQKGIN